MELKDEQTIVSLLDKDPELKKYYEEHRELEKQLADFQHKHHLTRGRRGGDEKNSKIEARRQG